MTKFICDQCGKELDITGRQNREGVKYTGHCICGFSKNLTAEMISRKITKVFSKIKLNEFISANPGRITDVNKKAYNLLELKNIMQVEDDDLAIELINEFIAEKRFTNPDHHLEKIFVNV